MVSLKDATYDVGAILAEYLTSNVFLLGANAITMNGEIVNVDGMGEELGF